MKMTEIKLTSDELRLMSLFQSITSATARDCIVDEKMDRVIFVVNKGQMGLAIGRGGATIKQLQNMVPRRIELVEYSDNVRSEEHTSELQSRQYLVCRLLLEKKKTTYMIR